MAGGLLASLCCLGPLLFVFLGISGAGFALRLEPLRPYLLILTYGLLGTAFYLTYGRGRTACGPGGACEAPMTSRAGTVALWVAALVVVLTTTFPLYADSFL